MKFKCMFASKLAYISVVFLKLKLDATLYKMHYLIKF